MDITHIRLSIYDIFKLLFGYNINMYNPYNNSNYIIQKDEQTSFYK